jgi:hypothetical protein
VISLSIAIETMLPVRVPRQGNDGSIVRPVLEQKPIGFKQMRQVMPLVCGQPAPKRKVMGAFHHVDGVNLHKAELLNQIRKTGRLAVEKSLCVQQHSPCCLSGNDRERLRHGQMDTSRAGKAYAKTAGPRRFGPLPGGRSSCRNRQFSVAYTIRISAFLKETCHDVLHAG